MGSLESSIYRCPHLSYVLCPICWCLISPNSIFRLAGFAGYWEGISSRDTPGLDSTHLKVYYRTHIWNAWRSLVLQKEGSFNFWQITRVVFYSFSLGLQVFLLFCFSLCLLFASGSTVSKTPREVDNNKQEHCTGNIQPQNLVACAAWGSLKKALMPNGLGHDSLRMTAKPGWYDEGEGDNNAVKVG